MEPKEQVGRNIRARRADLGITQEEAAFRSGVHPVEFARAERGLRDMRISTVTKIAAGLGVSASELLRGVGPA
jgi:transcriptional regulator with XRE-family HTH domain